MPKSPLFSIITVTYNNLPGLQKTRESIKIQSFQEFEWVVIDGGSSDGSLRFLNDSAPPTPLLRSGPDGGIYDAMNRGIDLSHGAYLLFLNAGDALAAADTLARLHETITSCQTPPGFIYGDSLEQSAGQPSTYKPARHPSTKDWGMFTHHQAMLYARDSLNALRYDQRYKIAADYDFTRRFLYSAKNILHCPFPICVFESGGVSQQKALQGRREQFAIRKNLRTHAAKNITIYGVQTVAWNFRRVMPRAYWSLKSRPQSSSSPARSSGNSQNGSPRI